MFTIKQPNTILFGKYSSRDFSFPENCLIITSKGAKNRGWLDYLKIKNYHVFDSVESNPSIKTAEEIISDFKNLAIFTSTIVYKIIESSFLLQISNIFIIWFSVLVNAY